MKNKLDNEINVSKKLKMLLDNKTLNIQNIENEA